MNTTNLIEDFRLLAPPDYRGWWALAFTALLALVIFTLMRRRLARAVLADTEAAGPELWDAALAQLESLIPLLTREHSRDYAIKSTGILRRYIEARYSLRAPTLATEEFLVMARKSPALPADHRASLERFLELCDLLKFGRYLAPAAELDPLHAAAVGFVLASRSARPPHAPPGGMP
jgi:hypothetical protein